MIWIASVFIHWKIFNFAITIILTNFWYKSAILYHLFQTAISWIGCWIRKYWNQRERKFKRYINIGKVFSNSNPPKYVLVRSHGIVKHSLRFSIIHRATSCFVRFIIQCFPFWDIPSFCFLNRLWWVICNSHSLWRGCFLVIREWFNQLQVSAPRSIYFYSSAAISDNKGSKSVPSLVKPKTFYMLRDILVWLN